MKVLIIGSGGREHAIADAFARSPENPSVIVSPGNAGIAREYQCVKLGDKQDILQFVRKQEIDLVFIGPEQPIFEGLSDYLRDNEISVLAPSQAAARLETSKAFAKDLMLDKGIPTARYSLIHSEQELDECLQDYEYPVVLKADGLAAGKGVIICQDAAEAGVACKELLSHTAGKTGIVVEEYLSGWETSLFAFCDGREFQTSLFSQDHKQLYDNDLGPNTGGMGAICPVPEAETYRERIEQEIIKPILEAMEEQGSPYVGILYLGLMITNDGPKVIEFNCRFGDPETQVVLPLLKTDFSKICTSIVSGTIRELKLEWHKQYALAVVLAAPGYPGTYKKGIEIGITKPQAKIYFAGVTDGESGLVSSGGRVLAVMHKAATLQEARAGAYQALSEIDFEGKVFRTDIGLRNNHLT